MRVTITQIDGNKVKTEWERLRSFLNSSKSDLLIFPELPFCQWIYGKEIKDQQLIEKSISEHDAWINRLEELNVPNIIGTRPVTIGDKTYNEAWLWNNKNGLREIHTKYYLPNETGFWEANWFDTVKKEFKVIENESFIFGTMICTDMWFMKHAQRYGEKQAHLIIIPRSTEMKTSEKWINGGKTIGVISGAYSISSNHIGLALDGTELGGAGWISSPDGELIASTNKEEPFVTVNIDLSIAEQAKFEYPRYVKR